MKIRDRVLAVLLGVAAWSLPALAQPPEGPDNEPPPLSLAHLETLAREPGPDKIILVNLSGRGDKDVNTVQKALERQ